MPSNALMSIYDSVWSVDLQFSSASHGRQVVTQLIYVKKKNFLIVFETTLYEFVDISFYFYGIVVFCKVPDLMDTSFRNLVRSMCFQGLGCSFFQQQEEEMQAIQCFISL